MRTVALLLCLFHTIALVATSGTILCIGDNGHLAYEVEALACCDSDDACCDEEGGCDEDGGPHLAAGPDCGDCTDILSPVSSGIHKAHAAVASPPAQLLSIGASCAEAARSVETAVRVVAAGSRHHVLRC
ncbi:MAG: hypothetical protein AAB074_05235 [Planctomycetota bacterium]